MEYSEALNYYEDDEDPEEIKQRFAESTRGGVTAPPSSLLADLFASETEELREEILATPIEELLQQAMEEVGLYVFSSTLDYVDGSDCTGQVKVATDGMAERAKSAVEEILRMHGIEDFDWSDFPAPGIITVTWELYEQKA